jgi:acyl-CoA dehydrogenase
VDILSLLLCGTPAKVTASLSACFNALESLDASFPTSIDRAAAGGFHADRLGYAFVAGYRAALMRLEPSLGRASLCATEEGGAHPRAIQTSLKRVRSDAYTLDGKKTFATLASAAETLLVVASIERTDARNHLRVVRVPARRAGITVRDRAPLPFAPEIPHAEVTLENVRVERGEVLEGDGYERVLKPFRTIEDAHVTAAWLGYVTRLMRHAHGTIERALAAIVALRDVGARDPSAPETHVLLAGILASTEVLARDLDLSGWDDETQERWRRDRPLFDVARVARELRREAAWARIVPPAA